MSTRSNLDLVNECDVFPYPEFKDLSKFLSNYFLLTWEGTCIGYVPEKVVKALIILPEALRETVQLKINFEKRKLSLFQEISTSEARTNAAAALSDHWRTNHTFEVLKSWRSELYPVYGPGSRLLWSIERSCSALFGTLTYGVHLTAYTRDAEARHGIKFWVPRRAMHKQTFGGMLDNTVAGGMTVREAPLDSLVREAKEEASLQEELIRKNVKACGTVTYLYIRDSRAGGEVGLVQPECQYVYDLELPQGIAPKPNDGEVKEFYLWSSDDVQAALRKGEFKPNCALVFLDFFIRWGIINKENEKDYSEIKSRIHRKLNFPGPHEVTIA